MAGDKAKLLALGAPALKTEALADSAVALAQRTDFLLLHAYALSDRAELASLRGADGRADRAAAENVLRARESGCVPGTIPTPQRRRRRPRSISRLG